MNFVITYFRGDVQLKQVAIERFIDRPYSYGLDPLHGGLFYFLDIEICNVALTCSMIHQKAPPPPFLKEILIAALHDACIL
jgi:hypothetical protein